MGTKVTNASSGSDGVTLTVEPSKGGDAEELKADIVLVATGRRPYTNGLGYANVRKPAIASGLEIIL